ncbi:probable WRKY transcription factor 51 [Euphorbia lathyris]|uniref:probable WRKY transcription factor 51 n=1 Tax=Euphorbia lathyris TaxID=212925 RepID=UPI003313440A
MNYPENPNYNYPDDYMDLWAAAEFQTTDYLKFDEFGDDSPSQSVVSSEQEAGICNRSGSATSRNIGKCKKKHKVEGRVAFRTKSDLEVMDDGFKWRKYGKKSVKNNPNPRNYYKCSSEGCNVKKRVERDREDSRYVITTYEGVHTHESPSLLYYKQNPPMYANASIYV